MTGYLSIWLVYGLAPWITSRRVCLDKPANRLLPKCRSFMATTVSILLFPLNVKCMPHQPEMLAEREGRARASMPHFRCPESRGMLCVKFLHLYVFLLRFTLPRNGQGFPGATKSTYFLGLYSKDSDNLTAFCSFFRGNILLLSYDLKQISEELGKPFVPLYGCWNPNVCLDSTKDKIWDRAPSSVFHSRHYSHGASHNRGLVLQFVNDEGPTFCPRFHDEKHNAINLLLSNLICFCCAVELSNPRTRQGNSIFCLVFCKSSWSHTSSLEYVLHRTAKRNFPFTAFSVCFNPRP